LADLFYVDTQEPFDLTNATEVAVLFPATTGPAIQETLGDENVIVVGAAGAGKIQVTCPAEDTALMQINPSEQQYQDLQIVATINGVSQVDTLSIGSVSTGAVFNVTLNSQLSTYTAQAGEDAQAVFTALATLINKLTASINVSASVAGSGSGATLILTSTLGALGFSDVVSSNITKVLTTPSSGSRNIFILQAVLNIQPQSYSGA
jgi:hypothetical protein